MASPENFPQDRRINKWTGADESRLISAEALVVPSSSPYEVDLYEIPRKDDPSSVTVREGSSTNNVAPSEDTWIDEGNPSSTHASDIYLAAGRGDAGSGSYKMRALLKWDVSALPAAASNVKLYFYREVGYSAPIYSVHRVTAAWSASSANWTNQPAFDLVPAGTFQIVPNQMGWYFCDITALYNAWKAGTYANHGIVLRTDEVATDTVSNWTSVNSGTTANRPHMDIIASGALYEEVESSVAPAAGQVAVNYPYGILRFHSSAAGESIDVSYFGKGTLVGANRLWGPVPTGSSYPGKPGMMAADASYLYYCYAPNTWRRVAHSSF